ncbi:MULTISPECIES: DUF1120 domain-containing protein [unclassified Pseudomonas]|uniref:DUF1120 domain-containing protein n=1 Tax=unclassified Pseudomonas TaxID=196821 RepID=UPI002AC9D7F9|nr:MULTISPECIES: DUF1120 domain-containing protein [unclassified Pseudomonas]MEB0047321.1 DUF1120 domain-containing protein [Pseudomonas sp. Dout3]MEB0096573.1 DUF1120 domain-containing protein [Pseudomonas sp. DC1.2]WPX60306.1 DUF1120 domain-containing protein [Pseudomonas sp. DC1.2]
MRFQTKALFATLMLASASSAFAASTADLKVIGTVIPGACTPVFAGGGVVDYGKISASDLSATATSNLQSRQIAYTITCDAPIVVGTSWVDNRLSSASLVNEQVFGLGTQGVNKIGFYTLRTVPGQTLADGVVADSIVSDGLSGVWIPSATDANVITQGARNRIYSFAAPGTLIPAAHTTYSGAVSVAASIAPTNTLDLATPITLDGLSTMEVRYL